MKKVLFTTKQVKLIILFLGVILLSGALSSLCGATIVGSKHDFGTPVGKEVCAFCHTPHGAADPTIVPLWNRNIQDLGAYTVYGSGTMNTSPSNAPGAASLACLSCHDQAPGGAASSTHRLRNAPGAGGYNASYTGSCTMCHQGQHGSYYNQELMIGPNLTDDHPVSMTYPTNALDPFFHAPPDMVKGWSDIKLYNGKIECASCHDPHNPSIVPFLRKSNAQSAMCTTCHIK